MQLEYQKYNHHHSFSGLLLTQRNRNNCIKMNPMLYINYVMLGLLQMCFYHGLVSGLAVAEKRIRINRLISKAGSFISLTAESQSSE